MASIVGRYLRETAIRLQFRITDADLQNQTDILVISYNQSCSSSSFKTKYYICYFTLVLFWITNISSYSQQSVKSTTTYKKYYQMFKNDTIVSQLDDVHQKMKTLVYHLKKRISLETQFLCIFPFVFFQVKNSMTHLYNRYMQ